MDTDDKVASNENKNWIYYLAFVCLGILVYGYLYSSNDINNLGYLSGQNMLLGAFFWGIFRLTLLKQGSQSNSLISLVLIFGALMAGDLIAYSKQEKDMRQSLGEIQKSISELSEVIETEQGAAQRIEKKFEVASTSSGSAAEVERFMKNSINKIVSMRNDYLLELNAIGWSKILDPERVLEDKTLIKSKAMLGNAYDILAKYRMKNYALLDEMRNDIFKLNLNEATKKSFADGYDKGLEDGRANAKLSWDLEELVLKEFENIINLLSASNGTWKIENNQVLFSTDEDVNAYNSYIASIQSLVEKQQNIQKQNLETINNKLSDYKK